jgi:hypothetical protein
MGNNNNRNSGGKENISHHNYLDKDRNIVQVGRVNAANNNALKTYIEVKFSSDFLRFILVLLSVFVSLSVAILELWKFAGDSAKSNQKIELVIRSKTNEPLSNVEISLIGKGAPLILKTDSNGHAEVMIPRGEQTRLILSKQGFQSINLITNLTTKQNNAIYIELEPENSNSEPSPLTTPQSKK